MLVFINFSIRYVIAAYAIWQKGVIDKCRYLDVIGQIYKFALPLRIGILIWDWIENLPLKYTNQRDSGACVRIVTTKLFFFYVNKKCVFLLRYF